MEMGKLIIKTKECKLLLDAFQLRGNSRHNGAPHKRGIFELGSN
jgi:hypothetical protein